MFPNDASALQIPLETRIYLLRTQYCTLSTAVLTLQCWISTFDEEVATFWKGSRVTGATVIFTLNRYLGLLYGTLSVVRSVFSLSDKSCAVLLPTTNILGQVLTLIAAAFTALRVFALSKKSWSLALICLGVPILPVVLFLLMFKGLLMTAKSIGPGLGCAYTSTESNLDAETWILLWSERSSPSALALSILSSFIADGQLIYFTWVAIAPLRGTRAASLARGRSLLHVFFRNEIFYFIVIIGADVLTFIIEIVFFVDPTRNYTYIATFTGMIPCLLISQFLLELQAADRRARAGGSQFSSADSCVSSVVFQQVVGSIGHASLTPREDDDGDQSVADQGDGEASSVISVISVWKTGDDEWEGNQVAGRGGK